MVHLFDRFLVFNRGACQMYYIMEHGSIVCVSIALHLSLLVFLGFFALKLAAQDLLQKSVTCLVLGSTQATRVQSSTTAKTQCSSQ